MNLHLKKPIWSSDLAYAIGLIATDGNLSIDGRHISFTSKDFEQIENFRKALHLTNAIGKKARGGSTEKKYFVVQFGSVAFYKFLLNIGITPRKSKTIGELMIPKEYFYDFLRGCLDGDGNINEFSHPESRHLQLKVRFFSASKKFLEWIQKMTMIWGLKGFITTGGGIFALVFAKKDSKKILNLMYYRPKIACLTRKYSIAKPYLD